MKYLIFCHKKPNFHTQVVDITTKVNDALISMIIVLKLVSL